MTTVRRIAIAGAANFRDLGGYETTDGKTVKYGMAYRSDDLHRLDEADLATLDGLGLRTVVDFRDQQETSRLPDRLPRSVEHRVAIPIEAGKLLVGFSERELTRPRAIGVMISVYRALVHEFQPAFGRLFRLLADPARLPLLFHCTAGKDRTGFAAALFLSALGVDREDVYADYLLSNELLKARFVPGVDYDDALQPMYGVERTYLDAAFEVVDNSYGGVEKYLRDALGVDAAGLRRIFTE